MRTDKEFEKLEKDLEKHKKKVEEQQVIIEILEKIKTPTPISLGFYRARFK